MTNEDQHVLRRLLEHDPFAVRGVVDAVLRLLELEVITRRKAAELLMRVYEGKPLDRLNARWRDLWWGES
jgi:hypothetical protein